MAIDFKKIFRRLVLTLIITAVLFAILGTYLLVGCLSEGERAGQVIKFSNKGYVFKTWEGELVQRNFSTQADTWTFSVKDEATVHQINDAMAKGDRVTLHYCQKYYTFFWQGDTDYFIDKVTVVPEQR
ncbi:MAG: hypothetical protein ACOYOA_00170 [Saprospiraceae bacterium]